MINYIEAWFVRVLIRMNRVKEDTTWLQGWLLRVEVRRHGAH